MRYYVDVNAVQGGDGSSEKPFRKIQEAADLEGVQAVGELSVPPLYMEVDHPRPGLGGLYNLRRQPLGVDGN